MKRLTFMIGIALLGTLSLAVDNYSYDPSLTKTSARTVALGNAFIGKANDYSAMFMNPAGLVQVKNMQFGAMQNTLLDTIFTLNGGVVFPMENMTFGIGGNFSGVSGIPLATVDPATGRLVKSGSSDYSNTMLAFSMASNVDAPIFNNVAVGLTGKFFMENTGSGIDYSSSGFNADFGALYSVAPALSLGLAFNNFLPTKIKYNTDNESQMDYKMSLGSAYRIVGDGEGSLIYFDNQSVDLMYDVEVVNRQNQIIHRIGLEYMPYEFLAFRAGMSMEPEATGSSTTGTATKYNVGVGFNYAGFQLDYAYSLDPNNLSANNSHYVSMLVDVFNPKSQDGDAISYITVDNPKDNYVTYKKLHNVFGSVVPGVASVRVNNRLVDLYDGTFEASVEFNDYGKQVIRCVAYDSRDKILEIKDVRVLYLTSFVDVPERHWARQYVEELATVKLIKGYPDGTFRPANTIKRSELAALLTRTKQIPLDESFDGTGQLQYTDLNKHWAAKYVQAVSKAGLMDGYGERKFEPNKAANRVETVTSVVKMEGGVLASKELGTPVEFQDLKDTHWAYSYVQSAIDFGMIAGYPDGTFRPTKPVSRAEIAKILYNSQLGNSYVKDLFDWSSYKYNGPGADDTVKKD